MKKNDVEIKKEINENENIKNDNNEINYSFIKKIIQKEIGTLIDEFLILNMGNKINKFIADSFTRFAIMSFNEAEMEIINEIKKLNKQKKE